MASCSVGVEIGVGADKRAGVCMYAFVCVSVYLCRSVFNMCSKKYKWHVHLMCRISLA